MYFAYMKETEKTTPFMRNLARFMAERKLSLAKLSEETGISLPTVYSWRQGRTPKGKNLEKLCAYFGTTAAELLKPTAATTAAKAGTAAASPRADKPGNQPGTKDQTKERERMENYYFGLLDLSSGQLLTALLEAWEKMELEDKVLLVQYAQRLNKHEDREDVIYTG